MNHQGEVVIGSQPVNRAAFVLHSAIHQARPDVIAAAHAHSVHGKAFSSLGIPLAPITQDACVFYDDHTLIAEQGGAVVFEVEAGKEFASKFPTGKAAIHQNHGLFTVGSRRSTRRRSGSSRWSDRARRSCWRWPPAHRIEIRHEYAQYTLEQTGFPLAGWFSFQPLWQEICRTDPDLFD